MGIVLFRPSMTPNGVYGPHGQANELARRTLARSASVARRPLLETSSRGECRDCAEIIDPFPSQRGPGRQLDFLVLIPNRVGRRTSQRSTMADLRKRIMADGWAVLPLRLIIGFGFAAHGYAKLARGPEQFARILEAMTVPAPMLMAWVTSLLEFFGGISLMLGAAVVPLSVPLALVMITALFRVHLQYGFSSIRLKGISALGAQFGPVGYELNLLYIAGLATLALSAASPCSVDRWLQKRRTKV